MKALFPLRILFSVLLLSSIPHALAQNAGAGKAYDYYPEIKDKLLHDAMNAVSAALAGPITNISKLSPEYKPVMMTAKELLSGKEAIEAMCFLLDFMATPEYSKQLESTRIGLGVKLGAAIESGNPEFLPGLKKLAPITELRIRGELLNAGNYLGIETYYSPSGESGMTGHHYNPPHPQLGLMKEMVKVTLEQMPSEASTSEEFVRRREDFITAVRTYCIFSTLRERGEIIPYVEKFLTKYDLGFEQFYRPRLYRNLREKSDWSGIRRNPPEEGTWESIHGRQPSRIEKLAWVAGGVLVILGGGFFFWRLFARRKSSEGP